MFHNHFKTIFYFLFITAIFSFAGCGRDNHTPVQRINVSGISEKYKHEVMIAVNLMNSYSSKKRKAGLQILIKMFRSMDHFDRDIIADGVIKHYHWERIPNLKSFIVGKCFTNFELKTPAVFNFLRSCINSNRDVEAAAFSIVALFPSKSLPLFEYLLRHPLPLIRYKAALALSSSNNQACNMLLVDFLQNEKWSEWPDVLHGKLTSRQARENLSISIMN
ncbi:MAG: HEAT repeat domain-containing protein [Planctomycetota bacterium]|jgi:hypothetical protein